MKNLAAQKGEGRKNHAVSSIRQEAILIPELEEYRVMG
jgi:hypothetical protein